VSEKKKGAGFWFGMDAETFYPAFHAELERRLKILDEKLRTEGSLVTKCPMWSYAALAFAMLWAIVFAVLGYVNPIPLWAHMSFYGSLLILVVLIGIDRVRKGR
jgi:hypothetical protein